MRGGPLHPPVYNPAVDRGEPVGVMGNSVVLCAAEAGAIGQEAAEGDGTVGIDEGCGKVLLAWVDVERGMEEGEEVRAGG